MSYIMNLRKIVGHAPIMAVAATGIVYDNEKGLLLEKRADTGEWCVPGGSVELGEYTVDALKRELKEETNLDITNPELFLIKENVHMLYPNGDEVYYTDFVYKINEFRGELMSDGESTELCFFSLNALPENIMLCQKDYIDRFVKENI